jgi:hypothetical protein
LKIYSCIRISCTFILYAPPSSSSPPIPTLPHPLFFFLFLLACPHPLSLLLALLSAPHTASMSCVASYILLGVMFLRELVASSSGPLIASIRSVKHTTSQHNAAHHTTAQHNTACDAHLTSSLYPSHTINMISLIDSFVLFYSLSSVSAVGGAVLG